MALESAAHFPNQLYKGAATRFVSQLLYMPRTGVAFYQKQPANPTDQSTDATPSTDRHAHGRQRYCSKACPNSYPDRSIDCILVYNPNRSHPKQQGNINLPSCSKCNSRLVRRQIPTVQCSAPFEPVGFRLRLYPHPCTKLLLCSWHACSAPSAANGCSCGSSPHHIQALVQTINNP